MEKKTPDNAIPVVVVGYGKMGQCVVSALLAAVGVRDPLSSRFAEDLSNVEQITAPSAFKYGDVIVDCASPGSFGDIADQ